MNTAWWSAKKDPYRTLGVPRTASAEDIKRAFRKLAMDLHPDRNGGSKAAEAAFKEVGYAYEILKDDARRASFDLSGSDDAWQNARARGADQGRGRKEKADAQSKGSGSRSGHSKNQQHSRSHPHRERLQMAKSLDSKQFNPKTKVWTLKLSLIEAIFGGDLTLDLLGTTFRLELDPNLKGGDIISYRFEDRRGQKLSLKLKISIRKDPVFRRVKNDIYVKIPITLRQAYLGGPVRVPTIFGSVTTHLRPPLGGSGRFRIPNYGIDGGHQFVEYQVALPKASEPELEAFLRNWTPRNSEN